MIFEFFISLVIGYLLFDFVTTLGAEIRVAGNLRSAAGTESYRRRGCLQGLSAVHASAAASQIV